MSLARIIIGTLLIIAGIVAAFYIDIVYLLVGGLNECADGLDAQPIDWHLVVFGIFKVVYLGGAGVVIGAIVVAIGVIIIKWGSEPPSGRRDGRRSGG